MEPTAGDRVFVDTNILLAATDRSRSNHARSREALEMAGRRGLHLVVNGQVIREYLVVATRPVDANGLGMTPEDAATNVERILRRVDVLDETVAVAEQLCALTTTRMVRGKRIHDANLVATMLVHGVEHLLTAANAGDFRDFSEINIVDG